MRRHKIERKKHKTISSVVHIGKAHKIKRKYLKPSKKSFDHSPHEVGNFDSHLWYIQYSPFITRLVITRNWI